MSDSDGLSMLLLSDNDFTINQSKDIPELIRIEDAAKGACDVHPVGLEVQVSLAAAKAFLRGADIYAAGVIAVQVNGNDKTTDSSSPVSIYVCKDGKCTRGLKKPYTGPKEFIGLGRMRMSRDQIFAPNPQGLAIEQVQGRDGRMPSFAQIDRRLFFPQNLASIVAVRALVNSFMQVADAAPLHCLDMCAAPGGKSLHLAALLETYWPGSKLVAGDRGSAKVARLAESIAMAGATNTKVIQLDATHACGGQLFPPETFDLIILDPPCSGIGQRPVFAWEQVEISCEQQMQFALYQKRMAEQAVHLLRPGGMMLYCTCTMLPEENERVIAHVLDDGNMHLVKDPLPFGGPGLNHCGLPDPFAVRRFWPDQHDTIGFFYAILQKRKI